MKCTFLSVMMAVVMHVFMSRYTDQTTLSDCTLRFYREKNVTFGFCNVSQVKGSDVTQSCRWLERERKKNKFNNPVYGTISLASYTDERGHQYYRGSCIMNTTKFTQNLTSTYRVELGTTYQSVNVREELSSFPVTTTSFKGQSRQFLSSIVSSVISNESSGQITMIAVGCIIGLLTLVIVVSAIFICKKWKQLSKPLLANKYANVVSSHSTSNKSSIQMQVEGDVSSNGKGMAINHEVTSDSQNVSVFENVYALAEYEEVTSVQNEAKEVKNVNVNKFSGGASASAPVSKGAGGETPKITGDVYAVVHKVAVKQTPNPTGDVYAAVQKQRKESQSDVKPISHSTGEVYATVNKPHS